MRILAWQDYFVELPHHRRLAERANYRLQLTARLFLAERPQLSALVHKFGNIFSSGCRLRTGGGRLDSIQEL